MATRTPFEVINHTRRVCSLYKKCCRNLLSWYTDRALYRYHATVLRADFDKNRDIKDMSKALKLVEQGERDLYDNIHYQPNLFANSPGGVAYGREVHISDSILDYWDPVEKAFYPEYFKKREQRKKEYMELWQKKYGKVNPADYEHHHH